MRPRRRPLQEVNRIGRGAEFSEQLIQFVAECAATMMFLLAFDVSGDRGPSISADRKGSVSALPSKVVKGLERAANPDRRSLFELADDGGDRVGGIEAGQYVDVIIHAADLHVVEAEAACSCGQVGVDAWSDIRLQKRTATPCREDDVKLDVCICVHDPRSTMRKSRDE